MSPHPVTYRNVVLEDHHRTVLAGFYQYGTVSWKTLFDWLSLLFHTTDAWIIVGSDCPAPEQQFPTGTIVRPGKYVVLAADWSPLHVKLVSTHARAQLSTLCRERTNRLDLQSRARHRNCHSSGAELSWCRLQAAHIFSASQTRPGLTNRRSGSAKPSSLRNMLFLREDLHDAWADYEFGIDPDDEYRIVAFVSGHEAIAGQYVEMRTMAAPGTRPFDALLRDHFVQGVLKHVKGRGERHWDFASGAMDLSDARTWGSAEAKGRLEREFGNRLFEAGGGAKQIRRMDGDVAVEMCG
ncbi:hypothetical protein BC628DRAFT_1407608 [Trametes gibbosa]|nr:hypothetical protein BC628DRAFT_1407608 [Trametes gibbosa]